MISFPVVKILYLQQSSEVYWNYSGEVHLINTVYSDRTTGHSWENWESSVLPGLTDAIIQVLIGIFSK